MEYIKCYQDIDTSQKIAALFPKYIKKKECYRNIWELVVSARLLDRNTAWQVAYGCVQAADQIFAAHAFFYDTVAKKAIDPTLPGKKSIEDLYYVAAAFDERDYLRMAAKNRYLDPVRNKDLKKLFDELQQYGLKNNFVVIV